MRRMTEEEYRARRRRNPEGEHHEKKGTSWLLIGGLAVGAFLLLRSNAFAGVLGGTTGYTAVGTDGAGHPIYQGPAGSVAPPGYVQTGVNPATGQPIYSYSGSGNILGTASTILGAGSGIASFFSHLFGGSSGGGAGVTGAPLPSGGTSVTSPDILTSGGSAVGSDWTPPDISLPDLTLPDWLTGGPNGFDLTTWLTGADTPNLDVFNYEPPNYQVPSLSLDVSPATSSLTDFWNTWVG